MVGFLCASSQQLLTCNALTGLQPQDPRFPETCQTKLILTEGGAGLQPLPALATLCTHGFTP